MSGLLLALRQLSPPGSSLRRDRTAGPAQPADERARTVLAEIHLRKDGDHLGGATGQQKLLEHALVVAARTCEEPRSFPMCNLSIREGFDASTESISESLDTFCALESQRRVTEGADSLLRSVSFCLAVGFDLPCRQRVHIETGRR